MTTFRPEASPSPDTAPVPPSQVSPYRIAIAHEWLVSYAGSERVIGELLAAFPHSSLLTTLLRAEAFPAEFAAAEPSFLQRLPGAVGHHEWMLPLMPLSWRVRKPIVGADAVVSSSHACANAIRMAPGIPHLSYCHTPMRYAWDFASERSRFPGPVRPAARAMMVGFRRWDRSTAQRVTRFVANSLSVAQRIARHYGRVSEVIHPPVDTEFFRPGPEPVGDTFLYVGRLVSYKRADLAVEAFAGLPEHRLVVVGAGHLEDELRARATPNVTFLGRVDDRALRTLYRTSRAMVFPAEEDFGISMAEAQACGTPVLSVNRGGALDIVRPGTSGLLVDPDDVGQLRRAVRDAASTDWDRAEIRRGAESFSAERFRDRMRAAVEEMVANPRPR
jgi:glycosyltransferase involved in cell wall biosynthesis